MPHGYDSISPISSISLGAEVQQFIDALSFDVIVIDAHHRILMANAAFLRSLGVNAEEVLGQYCPRIVHGIDGEYPGCPLAEAVTTDGPVEHELFDHASGRWYKASLYPARLQSSAGETVYIHTIQDVTEKIQAEELLRQNYSKLQRRIESTINAVAHTIELRDPYTGGHQRRVTQLATALAKEMDLAQELIEGVHFAAVVHDIGKIAIPSEILSKPGNITDIEFALIQTHAQVGYDLLKEIEFPWLVAETVLQHHERLDGSGYPNRLSGDAIHLETRVLSVADVMEAMCSHRPYRPALGVERALEEIVSKRGAQFDADVVDACRALFTEKNFSFI